MISGIGSVPTLPVDSAPARPSRPDDAGESGSNLPGHESAGDHAEFSPEALRLAAAGESQSAEGATSPAEAEELKELRQRDLEVRAHEAAHMAAGGSHIRGGASYSYQAGPDGRSYAVGGEVGIDTSAVPNDPQATIAKMQQIRAAALAPGDPSSADQAVAAAAAAKETAARAELAEKQTSRVAGAYAPASAQTPAGQLMSATA